jgi:hypothetical protein
MPVDAAQYPTLFRNTLQYPAIPRNAPHEFCEKLLRQCAFGASVSIGAKSQHSGHTFGLLALAAICRHWNEEVKKRDIHVAFVIIGPSTEQNFAMRRKAVSTLER